MNTKFRHSIVASIPACHAGDQGSIPCDGELFVTSYFWAKEPLFWVQHANLHLTSLHKYAYEVVLIAAVIKEYFF